MSKLGRRPPVQKQAKRSGSERRISDHRMTPWHRWTVGNEKSSQTFRSLSPRCAHWDSGWTGYLRGSSSSDLNLILTLVNTKSTAILVRHPVTILPFNEKWCVTLPFRIEPIKLKVSPGYFQSPSKARKSYQGPHPCDVCLEYPLIL